MITNTVPVLESLRAGVLVGIAVGVSIGVLFDVAVAAGTNIVPASGVLADFSELVGEVFVHAANADKTSNIKQIPSRATEAV
jgi:predicted transporter